MPVSARDGERKVLQAPVEVEVIGLAPHQARPALRRRRWPIAGLVAGDAVSASANRRSSKGASGAVVRVVMRRRPVLKSRVLVRALEIRRIRQVSLFALPGSPMTDRRKPRFPRENSRKQARSTELVAAILEAAVQVLAKEGAQRFTTARVAERAGVSVGSLYQYFPNKAAILFRLQSDEWRQTTELLRSILQDVSEPPLERLRALVHAFIRSECDEAAMRVALNDAAPLYRDAPEARRRGRRATAPSRPSCGRRCRRPRRRRAPWPGDLITTTLSTVGKHFSETPRTPAEIEAYADAMADMFCAYLKGLGAPLAYAIWVVGLSAYDLGCMGVGDVPSRHATGPDLQILERAAGIEPHIQLGKLTFYH